MKKSRVVYVCQQCGRESPKWMGCCPACNEWNSFVERTLTAAPRKAASIASPQQLSDIEASDNERVPMPIGELSRVLGGELVAGSLVLIGGEPGIGKSTLLLQAAASLAANDGSVVYVSGEETLHQTRLRAQRLKIKGDNLYLLAETDLEAILRNVEGLKPCMVVVDSIQAICLPEIETAPGSINQVRECTFRLMRWAKTSRVPVIITGHVTKEGAIAGPRVLEHIVDCVLYLEGEAFSTYRILRSVKNRFGSTNEIGIFEMQAQGLAEVENPSQVFLSRCIEQAVGSAIVPALEGSRTLLVEIQALTNITSFGLPRRTANGVDFGRLLMLAAVLSRRAGLKLGNQDIIVNAAGGIKVDEPAADLAIALAICSSFTDKGVDPQMVAVGEVGLSGEIRGVSQLDRRISEVARLGFKRCLVPASGARNAGNKGDIRVIPISTLKEAIKTGLVGGKV